ncbi:hypothetical protein KAR29_09575 [Aminithiophilus ramosus]|uniref:Uncharacterized protein n=1 Tax=Aminithiophilus ramosus TaxID=3029084 RepID=A0A9Q7ADZ4_9BACT|nr:hypothetical protein [Aminithiophilus ramosus]QTX31609.1 hypothetical protein KAR29_09575 [Aminithiophilus ramosus]
MAALQIKGRKTIGPEGVSDIDGEEPSGFFGGSVRRLPGEEPLSSRAMEDRPC